MYRLPTILESVLRPANAKFTGVDHPALMRFEGWSDLGGRRFQLCKRGNCQWLR